MKGRSETTITSKNQISLPVSSLRQLGWQRGDHLLVQVLGDGMLVLTRRPESWTEAFSGKLGDVFGDHDDTLAYLDGERASWGPTSSQTDHHDG
jgi:bifunctional DNA-binding transcriptional regulator/antitoxin component of YhaV-PrlF toxin-antitoxin module